MVKVKCEVETVTCEFEGMVLEVVAEAGAIISNICKKLAPHLEMTPSEFLEMIKVVEDI